MGSAFEGIGKGDCPPPFKRMYETWPGGGPQSYEETYAAARRKAKSAPWKVRAACSFNAWVERRVIGWMERRIIDPWIRANPPDYINAKNSNR